MFTDKDAPTTERWPRVTRGGIAKYATVLLRFAILDYSIGIVLSLFYAPPENLGDFLFGILFQLIGGAVGIVPLAVVSAALWRLGETRVHSPWRVGLVVGLGSLIFMLFWVNMVLGSPPAQQPSQVLAISFSMCNGAYTAWKMSRSERSARLSS